MTQTAAESARTWIKFYRDGVLDETLTFDDAERRIVARGQTLFKAGVRPGDRVLIRSTNSVSAIISYLSLLRLGAVAVPINPLESLQKYTFLTKDCGAAAEINADGRISAIDGAGTPATHQAFERLATIIYTSGTTGQPKGVCLSWDNWRANAKALIEHHGLTPTTVISTPLPLFHCNAHGFAMYTSWICGCTLVLFDKVPENFLNVLASEHVEIASVVPAILNRLMRRSPDWKPHRSFRYFLTAAAPLSGEMLSSIMDSWGVRIIQGYGLTESTNFSCTVPIDLDDLEYRAVMLPDPSIGVALPGVRLSIDAAPALGETGELLIEAASNCVGYWGQEYSRTRIVRTGDLAYTRRIRNRDFYYIRGRVKDIINRGGEKIYPTEVEEELRTIGVLGRTCVFSVPDERLGEEVAVATISEFDCTLLTAIPSYRRPKVVFLLDDLYTTATGKAQRSRARDECLREDGSARVIWRHNGD